ncbi:MAG: alpha/beta fold hydrolase [Acidimicrobiales bacterium]
MAQNHHSVAKTLALPGGTAAVVAGWALQHTKVSSARIAVDTSGYSELTLPDDVKHHTVDTDDGGKIHLVEKGRGRPMVLLHGVTLSSEIWALQMRDLSKDFRVIALDQRGHGLSVPGKDGFGVAGASKTRGGEVTNTETTGDAGGTKSTGRPAGGPSGKAQSAKVVTLFPQSDRKRIPYGDSRGDIAGSKVTYRMAMDLQAVLETLDLQDAILVGHSMGGMVAMEYAVNLAAANSENRVTTLALTSTSADPLLRVPGSDRLTAALVSTTESGLQLSSKRGHHIIPKGDISYWSTRVAFGRSPDPAHVCLTERLVRSVPPAWVAEIVSSLVKFDIAGRLDAIRIPAYILVGSADVLTPPWYARRMASRITNAELHVLPGCGHMSMLERPVELASMLRTAASKSQQQQNK